jgi:hypothetical protein
MEVTKRVSNGFGHSDVTRKEFVKHWLDYAGELHHVIGLSSSGGYLEMQFAVEEGAGKMWDAIDGEAVPGNTEYALHKATGDE